MCINYDSHIITIDNKFEDIIDDNIRFHKHINGGFEIIACDNISD